MDKSHLKMACTSRGDILPKAIIQRILDNSFDEIFVTNDKGVVIYVNEACERHYGMKASEVIGKVSWELADKGYWHPCIIPIVLQDKKRITLEQETLTGKKLLVTATPVFDDDGNIILIVENSRDISELEHYKKNLKKVQRLATRYKSEAEELRKKNIQLNDFVAKSKKMLEIIEIAQRVGAVDANVLVTGETGTGKSYIAKYLHRFSTRKEEPFITINCAAIPEQLFESELFGYTPGAFTGANKNGKIGLVELADGGTLFLDEIGEIPLKLQAKLLEVIEEHKFIKVGGNESKNVDIRIIAATNRDLKKLVQEGQFRDDLYYRLNVVELQIPPLRERTADIIPLILHFVEKYTKQYGISHSFAHDTLDILSAYSWPGNIRELSHLVERLFITISEDVIKPEHLPGKILHSSNVFDADSIPKKPIPLQIAQDRVERELITRTYKELKSSYKVAKALNISQSKAFRLIKKYIKAE